MVDWIEVGVLSDIPPMGARVVRSVNGDIAVFRTADDHVFALFDRCPHKGGPLSEGIVHGRSVTCPLHSWVISLETGEVEGPDRGCASQIAVSLDQGRIRLGVPRASRTAHG
ncbi:MAG: nitrite reductase small subunit NirD [Rhodospirillaceae bacterium]|nr:nitrite reductase small subunit NirD [Rhodospirillaceae bacterium]